MTEKLKEQEEAPKGRGVIRNALKKTLKSAGLFVTGVVALHAADQFTGSKDVNLGPKPAMAGDIIDMSGTIKALEAKEAAHREKAYGHLRLDYENNRKRYEDYAREHGIKMTLEEIAQMTVQKMLETGAYTKDQLRAAGILGVGGN